MFLIDKLKGVFRRMIAPKVISDTIKMAPLISSEMKEHLELWENLYKDQAPWLTENVKSLGIPALIASEKARTATLEMQVKITGDSARAEFMRKNFQKVIDAIQEPLEYGIALGSFIIKPYVMLGPDNKYVMEFNFTRATNFYPLSFSSEGKLTECAFVDVIITKEYIYRKVEIHKLEGSKLTIRNQAYKQTNNGNVVPSNNETLGDPIELNIVPAWASLAPEAEIQNVNDLLFGYFKMPEANNVDLDSPLGVSGFSRAVDLIKEADNIYSDLLWEFEGGQLAIDVDRTALLPTSEGGKSTDVLPKLQDRLYRRKLDLGTDELYHIFSPTLRDSSILNGLNNQLMRIEDTCALSRGTLSVVTQSEARTATELKILKQRSYAANQHIQDALQLTFEQVFHAMDIYCDLYKIVPAGDYEVAYKWDDSIIVDKDCERQQDMLEVKSGLMSKVEYRMKWYGETKDQAEAALKIIQDEQKAALTLVQSQMNNGGTDSSTGQTTDAEASQKRLNRANDSDETTKIGDSADNT